MARAKQASKRSRSRKVLPVWGAAGMSLAMASGTSAAVVPGENAPSQARLPVVTLGEEELSDTVATIAKSRFLWLFANLLTAFVSSWVISRFEGSIEKMVSLGKNISPDLVAIAGNVDDPGRLSDLVASNLDLKVERRVVVDNKAVLEWNRVFEAQMLTYLRLTGLKLGLVINFGEQYVKNGIESWIHNWRRNGWKTSDRKDVKNADLWMRLDELAGKHRVRWHWVRGHAGHPENERADVLANRGVLSVPRQA